MKGLLIVWAVVLLWSFGFFEVLWFSVMAATFTAVAIIRYWFCFFINEYKRGF